MNGWDTAVIDGHVTWTEQATGQQVTGRVKAPCTDTPYDNPPGRTPHTWTNQQRLWVCIACHAATVSRPIPVCAPDEHQWEVDANGIRHCYICRTPGICSDTEHKWGTDEAGQERCTVCHVRVLDLYRAGFGA